MQLSNSSATLIGLALGIFGLAQAFLQIPFGHLSDKIGRKKVFIIGNIMLIIGLLIAYFAKSIYILIFARAVQGAGAIQGVAYAWIADSISGEKRNSAMGTIASVVGMSLVIAMIGGPALLKIMSVPYMFLICAILNFFVLIYIMVFLKTGANKESQELSESIIKTAVSDNNIIYMNFAGLILNYVMVSIFFIVPQFLNKLLGVEGLWKVLMPATVIGVVTMRYAVKSVRERYLKLSLISAFALILFGAA
jgi:MFS family permease